MNLTEILSRSKRTFLSAPLLLLLLQLPPVPFQLLENIYKDVDKEPSLVFILFVIPLNLIATAFTAGATYIVMRQFTTTGTAPTLKVVWIELKNRMLSLSLATLLSGVLIIMGLLLFMIPGFYLATTFLKGPWIALGLFVFMIPASYFGAVYLFVPQVTFSSDDKHAILLLSGSKSIAKKRLWVSLVTAMTALSGSFGVMYICERIAESLVSQHELSHPLAILPLIIATVIFGLLLDLWISSLFIALKE